MSFVSSIEEHTNMRVSISGDAVNSPSVRFLSHGAALSFRAMRGSGSLHTDTLVRSRKILLGDELWKLIFYFKNGFNRMQMPATC